MCVGPASRKLRTQTTKIRRDRTRGQNQLVSTAAPEAMPVAQVPRSMTHGNVVLHAFVPEQTMAAIKRLAHRTSLWILQKGSDRRPGLA